MRKVILLNYQNNYVQRSKVAKIKIFWNIARYF